MTNLTAHSEFGKLKSVFVKRSQDAFKDEAHLEKTWQSLNYLAKPDLEKANIEFAAFEQLMKLQGVELFHLPASENVNMDSIYCRDASIATNKGMIICNMGKAGRINEPAAEREAFIQKGISILGEILAPGTIEGGDVAWLDEQTLAVGHTYRTNEAGIRQLKSLLEPLEISVIVVPLPHYKGPQDVFHLMSILSPIDKDLAVVYSPLMPIPFRNLLLARGFKFVEVPEDEFESMGCNVLAIAPRKCIMVKGNPRTKVSLLEAGCEVMEYEGMEISVKGGGGPTCLTRPVHRLR